MVFNKRKQKDLIMKKYGLIIQKTGEYFCNLVTISITVCDLCLFQHLLKCTAYGLQQGREVSRY